MRGALTRQEHKQAIQQWISAETLTGSGMSSAEGYAAYSAWAAQHDLEVCTLTHWGRTLSSLGYTKERQMRRRERHTVYLGITLKSPGAPQ